MGKLEMSEESVILIHSFIHRPPMGKYVRFLLLSLVLLGPGWLLAQRSKSLDKVYIKGGKAYEGKILPQENATKVKLQTPDLSILWFDKTNVDSIVQKEWLRPQQPFDSILGVFRPRKVTFRAELGFERLAFWDQPIHRRGFEKGFSTNVGIGYNFTSRFALGIELGVQRFFTLTTIPLAADIRVRCLKKRLSPTLSLGIGHAFAWRKVDTGQLVVNDEFLSGGTYAAPQIGVSYCASRRVALHLTAGIHVLQLRWKTGTNGLNPDATQQSESGFGIVRAGVTF